MMDVCFCDKKSMSRHGYALFVAVALIALMLMTSWMIRSYFADTINQCSGSSFLVHFCPTYNEQGSALNLYFSAGYDRITFLVLAFLSSIVALILYSYETYLFEFYKIRTLFPYASLLLFAACGSRFLDRLIWEYTLDYIAIKGICIADLSDLYFSAACICLIFFSCMYSRCERVATISMNKKEKIAFKKELNRGFIGFLRKTDYAR